MGITHEIHADGVAEVVMDNPPVNALTVAGWFELADAVRRLGEDRSVRALVLRAEVHSRLSLADRSTGTT